VTDSAPALTRTLFVATGERLRDIVIIRVFAVG
jgi:hypothetical protein